ncbi:MAG TPA: hypothetical protein VMU89_17085 [Thermomicrobiaceae bacterium]|nr:hypothetical protein [Thermomicrobiaceae bacterium]
MTRVVALIALLVLAGAVLAAPAAAAPKILDNTDLVAVTVPGQVVRGIPGGGFPWVIDEGSKARVDDEGEVKVVVHGLLFAPGTPFAGTTGPVHAVFASVVCADGSVASTATVPLSSDGDALIRDTVMLPAGCADPILLVRAPSGAWLAEAGL